MPRPSLKQQRSQEILDAFVRCVARFGLEGATQERIAEEAGVRRTLLRHYLGNRDQMIAALVDHVVAKYDALTEGLQSTLAASESGEMLLDILFTPSSHADQQLTLVFQALVTTSSEYPATQKPLLGSITRFIRLLEKQFNVLIHSKASVNCKPLLTA